MKAKIFLAATLMLALAIGSANANPVSTEVNKATTINHIDAKSGMAPMHHHHRRHHHHHMMKH
jgi:hypothetical protein